MKNTLQPRVNGALTVAPPPFQRTYYPTNAERIDDKLFHCCLTPRTKPYASYDEKIRSTRKQISIPCCASTQIPVPPVPQPPEISLLSQRGWEFMGDLYPIAFAEFAKNGYIYAGGNDAPIVLKYDGSWISLSGTITGNELQTITVDGDGVVYAGGIIYIGESIVPFVASYDTSSGTWIDSIGGYIGTITYGSVRALATGPNGVVYAAGNDGSYPFVAFYNKESGLWTNMSNGVMLSQMGSAYSLTIDSIGTIYVGGNNSFNLIFVYAYSGEWIDINYGGEKFSTGVTVSAMTVGPDQYVYAGGKYGFSPQYPYVMRFDTIAHIWTTLYDNSTELRDGKIESIIVSDGLLYACGNNSAFSVPYVLQYDGASWIELTNSFPGRVYALCINFSGTILAGGDGFIASYQPYTLTWSSPPDSNTFNVYSQILPASPVRVLSGLTVHYANISNLISITPVQFYVTSVSVSGLESVPSNIVVYS